MRVTFMSDKLFERMKLFAETSEFIPKVTSSLKEGAAVEVCFEGDPAIYGAVKEKGRIVCSKYAPRKPQMRVTFSEGAMDYLLEPAGTDKDCIDEYVTRFGECMLHPTPTRKVRIKTYAGIITGFRMGYFGMLRFGGPKALEMLSKFGIKIPKRFLGR